MFVAALYAGGKPFVFTRTQMEFLLALQKMKNLEASAMSVGKEEGWAKGFLASKKFKAYLTSKMLEFSIRNGMTIEWWYTFGKWLTEGYRELYRVKCHYCEYEGDMNTYEVEQYRQDDMTFAVPCPACYKSVVVEHEKEVFKPTREQVEGWKELGSRLIPKVERVHHQFENTEIVFESQGDH